MLAASAQAPSKHIDDILTVSEARGDSGASLLLPQRR